MRSIQWGKNFFPRTLSSGVIFASLLLFTALVANVANAAGFTYHMVQAPSGAMASAERNFSYYIPTTYTAGTPSRLWVVIHGCRQTDRTMTDLVGMESLAERDNAIILYPFENNDASTNDNDGRYPNCWGFWKDPQIHRDAGEAGDVKRMVDYMKSNFSVDNNRVHVAGISGGGAMASIMQVTYPDVFASASMVEGVAYGETAGIYTGTSDCAYVLSSNGGSVLPTSTIVSKMRQEMQKSGPLRQPPVLIMHNKKDCTVPIKVGLGLIDSFMNLRAADGLAVSATPTSTTSGSPDGLPYVWSKYGTSSNGQSLVETILFDVSEAQVRAAGVIPMTEDIYEPSSNTVVKEDIKRGHWWSGAAQRGPWIINKGLNAGLAIADFFNAHPMNGVPGTTTSTSSGTTTTTMPGTTTTTQQVNVQPGTAVWTAATWAADAQHGGSLQGYYYWPSAPPAINGKRALVLALHGCAQTAAGNVISVGDGGYNWQAMADQYGAVILAPNATGNVAGYHCWDYYGASHSRTAGHSGVLLDLVKRFKDDAKYAIDPSQVYVAGLSSGAGEAMVLGCLAPDVFAGISSVAGPSVGTSLGNAMSFPYGGYTGATARNACQGLAGNNASYFATQIANITWGTSDIVVPTAYGPVNTEMMRLVLGGTYSSSSLSVPGGGSGTQYTQNGKIRISEIRIPGMGHAWPAGPGGESSAYVDSGKVNLPQYLMNFWNANNLRIGTPNTTTTSTAGGTTTTTVPGTTTTTTLGQVYDQTASGSATTHYVAGRLNVWQYLALGARYGYIASFTLYRCPSLNGWTDKANCSPI